MTEPHKDIQETGARRQARLLSSLLIFLILLDLTGAIASAITWGRPRPAILPTLALAGILTIAYALSRSARYMLGAYLTLGALTLVGIFLSVEYYYLTLSSLVLMAFVIGGVLLPVAGILGLIVFQESFAYAVSHDLKAPLRSVDGYSRLLLSDHANALDEKGRILLENIRSAAETMNQMIDDLLKYSRLQRRTLVVESVHLPGLVQPPCERTPWRIQGAPGRALHRCSRLATALALTCNTTTACSSPSNDCTCPKSILAPVSGWPWCKRR